MKKLLIVLSLILALLIGHLISYTNINNVTLASLIETPKNQIIREIPPEFQDCKSLHRFERIVVDGDNDAVKKLYNMVSEEAQNLPDVFIDIFNKSGYRLIITDNVGKYTRQYIPPGHYLGGVTQEHGNDYRVVLFPVKSEYTSLYHELGHVIVSAYHMERETLPGIWKHDRKGAVALTGEYANSDANECWAEAFRFMAENIDNPAAMERAEKLMPISYATFQRLLKHGEEVSAA